MRQRNIGRGQLLVLFLGLVGLISAVSAADYMLIGVSGGLQEGFPAHEKLHYVSPRESEEVRAIYLGRGLVRGYKAFLDVMEPGWREYDPERPVINSNVFASGCHEHANEYWLYLVDVRQVLSVLNNEPRFLSMTPDTGTVELYANETSSLAREFLEAHFKLKGKHGILNAAIPLVTCVYFQENSHVPSPPMYTHDDGTQVTNFPDSLALWANVNDIDRTALLEIQKVCNGLRNQTSTCTPEKWDDASKAGQRYWHGIRNAIWRAELNRPTRAQTTAYAPPFKCTNKVSFGVKEGDGSGDARVNYPLSEYELKTTADSIGLKIHFDSGEISWREHEPSSAEL